MPFKIVKEHANHFVAHNGTAEFKIAKKGLSPQKTLHFQSLCSGGAVKPMAKGGEVEHGKLTAAKREKIPTKDFAGPDRSYPVEDEKHARLALAMAAKYASPEQRSRIEARVHAKYPQLAKSMSRGGQVRAPSAPAVARPRYADGGEVSTDDPAERLKPFTGIIAQASRDTGVDPYILAALSMRESNANPQAVGDEGNSHGMFQINRQYHPDVGDDVVDQAHAAGNILHQNAQLLGSMAERDPRTPVDAYNAGLPAVGRAVRHGKDPDAVTTGHDYGRDVLQRAAQLRQMGIFNGSSPNRTAYTGNPGMGDLQASQAEPPGGAPAPAPDQGQNQGQDQQPVFDAMGNVAAPGSGPPPAPAPVAPDEPGPSYSASPIQSAIRQNQVSLRDVAAAQGRRGNDPQTMSDIQANEPAAPGVPPLLARPTAGDDSAGPGPGDETQAPAPADGVPALLRRPPAPPSAPAPPQIDPNDPQNPNAIAARIDARAGQTEQALKLVAQGQQTKALADATANDWIMKRQAQLQQQFTENWQQSQASAKAAAESIANAKVDPQRYWNSKSLGQKVMTIISMALGGSGAAAAGTPNYAMQRLNTAIEQDIDAQKANIGNQKTRLAFYMDQGHELQQAYQLAKADALDVAGGMFRNNAARFQGQAAQQYAQIQAADLHNQADQARLSAYSTSLQQQNLKEEVYGRQLSNAYQLAVQGVRMKMAQGQPISATEAQWLDKDDKSSLVRIGQDQQGQPLFGPAQSGDSAKDIREKSGQLDQLQQLLQEPATAPWARSGMRFVPFSKEDAAAQGWRERVTDLISQTGTQNRWSPAKIKHFAERVPDYREIDIGGAQAQRYKELQQDIIRERSTMLSNNMLMSGSPGGQPGSE